MPRPEDADKKGADQKFEETFVQLLTTEQLKLLRYITYLLGDRDAANNVLQETNLVLWRKAREFALGTSFSAWAQKIAYWQVQAYVRDRSRDRHVFSEKLVEQLASRGTEEVDETESRLALRHCLGHTSSENRELLRRRYEDNEPIAALAKRVGKTQSAIKVRLMRIRQALQRCIEHRAPQ